MALSTPVDLVIAKVFTNMSFFHLKKQKKLLAVHFLL